MSDAERAEYDAAAVEAEARLQLAELVYNALTAAGLSQTELARGGAGTRQAVISAIKNGAQAPGGVMLAGSPTRSAARSRFASLPSPGSPGWRCSRARCPKPRSIYRAQLRVWGAGSVGATGAEAGCRKRSAQGQRSVTTAVLTRLIPKSARFIQSHTSHRRGASVGRW